MARFKADVEAITGVENDVSFIDRNFDKIFGGMTKAGADMVYETVMENLPSSFKNSNIRNCFGVTKTYKTPTDDGINNKVYYAGYFYNKRNVKTPAPLVINMFEYGSTKREYPKQPFFRKSFKKAQIKKVMQETQKKLSGGLLDE